MPRTGGKVLLATGYSKWGMTNAVAASLNLSSTMLDGQMDWAKTLGTRITRPPALLAEHLGERGGRRRAGKGLGSR